MLAPVVSLMKRDGLDEAAVARFKTYYRAAKERELTRQQQEQEQPEPEPEPELDPDEAREFQRILDGGRSFLLPAIVSGMRRDGKDDDTIERFKAFYRVRAAAPPQDRRTTGWLR